MRTQSAATRKATLSRLTERDGLRPPGELTAAPGRRHWRLVAGISGLGLITLAVLSLGSSQDVYVYDTFLLAALGAVALNLVLGTGGQVLIANPALLAVGSFTAVACVRSGIPFPADVIVATGVSGVVGIVIGLPSMRLRGLYLALSSVAALYIVVYIAQTYQSHAVGDGTFFVPVTFGGAGLAAAQQDWAWLLYAILSAVLMFIWYLTTGTRTGRAWRLIRDHERIAPSLGIPTFRYKSALILISSAIMGLQGALTAHYVGSVTYESYDLQLAITYLAMIFIGGLDSLVGSVVGAVIVTWLPIELPGWSASFIGSANASQYATQIAQIVYGLLVVLFVTSSANGVVGLGRALWIRGLALNPIKNRLNGRKV